jgi:hypothetical protein
LQPKPAATGCRTGLDRKELVSCSLVQFYSVLQSKWTGCGDVILGCLSEEHHQQTNKTLGNVVREFGRSVVSHGGVI